VEALLRRNRTVVVDEAFMDFAAAAAESIDRQPRGSSSYAV
jgi:histidinol-phosphate/aromatic aminotransferase/cobyric acid decarboxylase-like protein